MTVTKTSNRTKYLLIQINLLYVHCSETLPSIQNISLSLTLSISLIFKILIPKLDIKVITRYFAIMTYGTWMPLMKTSVKSISVHLDLLNLVSHLSVQLTLLKTTALQVPQNLPLPLLPYPQQIWLFYCIMKLVLWVIIPLLKQCGNMNSWNKFSIRVFFRFSLEVI